jgi:peptidoglycan hydrolase-like protein with peptidoglycan-binding domain
MHIESDKYAAKDRVGVFRPISGEKYNSLLTGGEESDMLLKTGSKGSEVEAWQRALKTLGYSIGAYGPKKDGVDGEFGAKTAGATKLFQKACGLVETGEVDDPTAAAMWGRARETEIAALGDRNKKLQGQISEALPGIKAAQSALERQP